MKKYKSILYGIGIALLMTACSDDFLTVNPTSTITDDRITEIGSEDPEALKTVLQPKVTGLYSWLIQWDSYGGERHNDFGVTAIGLRTDLMNDDMTQFSKNYGWYYSDYAFETRSGDDLIDTFVPWNYFYKLIKMSNDILASIGDEVTDEELIQFRGQALAMRGYAYLYLVQLYQHTYVGHQNDPAVPIVTDKSTEAEKANNPRASVSAVYDLILSDFTRALSDLDGFERPNKGVVNKQIVQGFLARTYLNMANYPKAAEFANAARQGWSLMTGDQYVNYGFKDLSEVEWMWGCDVTDQSDIALTGICNLPSHLSSVSYGYASIGNMQKCIDAALFDKISATDKRKAAWVAPTELGYKSVTVGNYTYSVKNYANLKFGRYSGTTTDNFNDYVLMRSSEMYLIEAEALANSNPAEAQQLLYEFVITRDPAYVKSVKTGTDLIEEIYTQRRIELWGEGFSYFDHKRLKKPIIRNYVGTNHNADAKLDYPAEDKVFRFRIPKREIQNNAGISEADNND